ncbi:MAG: arginine--tRNA ligase [Planctomycetaceae bacterium]
MSISRTLKDRFAEALVHQTSDVQPLLEMIRSSQDAKFGDFQANCAMPLGKQLGKSPREVAAEIVSHLNVSDLCHPPEIAGPGFINLRLKDEWIVERINAIAGDDRLGVVPAANPRHVVVDYSSPNVAKPMHVGHLRSSVIGDAICRTLKFAGHKVTSDNHIGDWGTQFGMIIYGYRNFVDQAAYQHDAVSELARLYKLVNLITDYHAAEKKLPQLRDQQVANVQRLADAEASLDKADKSAKKQLKSFQKAIDEGAEAIKSAEARIAGVEADAELLKLARQHPDIARLARQETSRLHAGDTDNQQLWDEFLPACLEALNRIYVRLGIEFDLTLGESYYNPMLADVVADLRAAGLATDSDGAVCIFIEGNSAPFIVQKSDGAYTYATTDLATIRYRVEQLKADEILYVVDKRQSEHFHLLFQTCQLLGYSDLVCRHLSFGTVMGPDGKPLKTRSGENVALEDLIDEAIDRARQIVNENDDARKGEPLNDQQRAAVAEVVGVGGIKYADLHHNRDSDYEFQWEKMLAKTGDTATYMQYAYARICGIFREVGVDRDSLKSSSGSVKITCPEERALALQLIQFDQAIEAVLSEYRPHLMTCLAV